MKKGLIALALLLGIYQLNAQSVEVQFEGISGPCNSDSYCVSLQVRSLDGADYIGTSSIRFAYDSSVILFDGYSQLGITSGSYTSTNFDGDQSSLPSECDLFVGNGAFYSPHAYDGRPPGEFLMTISLTIATSSQTSACPSIAEEWVEVSQICFDVLDPNGDPDFSVVGTENAYPTDAAGTCFNPDTNNPIGKYNNGSFNELHTSFNSLCGTSGVQVSLKALLQGAWSNNSNDLMRDDLRTNNLLPLTEPYSNLTNFTHVGGGGETTAANVLTVSNQDAIVDWVYVELRSAANPSNIIATRAGLLQKDGDITDVDGLSALAFSNVAADDYYVAIRHRNHLSVMTDVAYNLTSLPTILDFTTGSLGTYGNHAQYVDGNGKHALWMGNTSGDDRLIFQGVSNDINDIFFSILIDGNSNGQLSYIQSAYQVEDTNLDGQTIYQGIGNESNYIFFNVLTHPTNTTQTLNYIITEQMP